jgi:hypothetical protein
MTNGDECEAVGAMRISTRSNPVPVPLCPPQIEHDLTRDRTRATAAEGMYLLIIIRAYLVTLQVDG